MRWKRFAAVIGAFVLGAVASLAALEVAASTGPPRATLAPYHANTPDMKIFSKDTKDVVITQFSIPAGGSTGWHFHPGPTFIIVTQGTLTRYQSVDPTCTGTNYGPSTGFFESPGDVHIARNQGATTVVGMVAYLDVPVGGAVKTVVSSPGNCRF